MCMRPLSKFFENFVEVVRDPMPLLDTMEIDIDPD